MKGKFERHGPSGVAFVVAICVAILVSNPIDLHAKPVAAATMTFGVVVAGFTATMRQILFGISGSRVVAFLRRTRYYVDVLQYLTQGIYASICTTFISFMLLILSVENMVILRIGFALWISAIVWVIGILVRNEFMMHRLVQRFLEEDRNFQKAKNM